MNVGAKLRTGAAVLFLAGGFGYVGKRVATILPTPPRADLASIPKDKLNEPITIDRINLYRALDLHRKKHDVNLEGNLGKLKLSDHAIAAMLLETHPGYQALNIEQMKVAIAALSRMIGKEHGEQTVYEAATGQQQTSHGAFAGSTVRDFITLGQMPNGIPLKVTFQHILNAIGEGKAFGTGKVFTPPPPPPPPTPIKTEPVVVISKAPAPTGPTGASGPVKPPKQSGPCDGMQGAYLSACKKNLKKQDGAEGSKKENIKEPKLKPEPKPEPKPATKAAATTDEGPCEGMKGAYLSACKKNLLKAKKSSE